MRFTPVRLSIQKLWASLKINLSWKPLSLQAGPPYQGFRTSPLIWYCFAKRLMAKRESAFLPLSALFSRISAFQSFPLISLTKIHGSSQDGSVSMNDIFISTIKCPQSALWTVGVQGVGVWLLFGQRSFELGFLTGSHGPQEHNSASASLSLFTPSLKFLQIRDGL